MSIVFLTLCSFHTDSSDRMAEGGDILLLLFDMCEPLWPSLCTHLDQALPSAQGARHSAVQLHPPLPGAALLGFI